MKKILQSKLAKGCLDNTVNGADLYRRIAHFALWGYEEIDFEFDIIITILRAALPIGLTLYKKTNKPLGFISAKRQKDLSIEITYENIPKFRNPLVVDSWVATGSTVKAVCKHLEIKDINLFCVVASQQALDLISPKNYIVGRIVDEVNADNYIVPPYPFKPRDGGDDLFSSKI